MPRYTYKCDQCEETFETVHSMSKKLEFCLCENSGSVTKIMSPTFIARMNRAGFGNKKVGDVVNNHIEEAKKEVRAEKDRLKSIEYKQ
jgi:putative FmdB family regulatory protein